MRRGGKPLGLAIGASLKGPATSAAFRPVPGHEPWRCVRVGAYYVVFRFATRRDVKRGYSRGTRFIARLVERRTFAPGGRPPSRELVRELLSEEGAKDWRPG